MYCAACGTPLAPGLSYCNRCGMNLKERSDTKAVPVGSYLTAISIVGIVGLSLMLGGAIALKSAGDFHEELIGIFMFMTFMIVGVVELSLCRQLSRLNRAAEKKEVAPSLLQPGMPNEIRGQQPRALGEPVPSVTENTTRTLQYSHDEPLR
jgi:hypothetical protein